MVPNVRNLTRYKCQLAASLGLLIVMSLFPYLARANPFVTMHGTVHFLNHGAPYDTASTLTLMCPVHLYSTFSSKLEPIAESRCLGDTCSISSMFGIGFCSVIVRVAAGGVFNFNVSEGSPHFEAEIDVATGEVRARSMSENGPGPFPTFSLGPWGLFQAAMLLTAVIEVPTVLLAGEYLFHFSGLRVWRWLLVGLGANLITLPFAWFVVPAIFVMVAVDYRLVVNSASYSLIVAIVEGVIVLIEAEIYHRFVFIKRQHALALSLVANALSYGAGLVLF